MKLIRSPRSRYRWREIASNLWNAGLHSRESGPVLVIQTTNEREQFVLELDSEEAQKLAEYIREHTDHDGRLSFCAQARPFSPQLAD